MLNSLNVEDRFDYLGECLKNGYWHEHLCIVALKGEHLSKPPARHGWVSSTITRAVVTIYNKSTNRLSDKSVHFKNYYYIQDDGKIIKLSTFKKRMHNE